MLLEHYRQQALRAAAGPAATMEGRRLLLVAIAALLLGASVAILAAATAAPVAPAVPWQWTLAPVTSTREGATVTDIRLLSTLPFDRRLACSADKLPNAMAANLDTALDGLPTSATRHLVFLVAAGHDRLPLRSGVYETNIALAQARSDCVAQHIRRHPLCQSRPSACSVVNFVRSASDPSTEQGKVQDTDRAAQILILSREVTTS